MPVQPSARRPWAGLPLVVVPLCILASKRGAGFLLAAAVAALLLALVAWHCRDRGAPARASAWHPMVVLSLLVAWLGALHLDYASEIRGTADAVIAAARASQSRTGALPQNTEFLDDNLARQACRAGVRYVGSPTAAVHYRDTWAIFQIWRYDFDTARWEICDTASSSCGAASPQAAQAPGVGAPVAGVQQSASPASAAPPCGRRKS